MLNVAFKNTHHCLPKQPTAHLDWIITCQSFFLWKHLFSEQRRAVITLCGLSEGGNSANWAIRAEAGSGLHLMGACMGEWHHARGDNSVSVRTSQGKASDCAVKRARSVDWHTTSLTIQPPLGSGLIKLPFRPQNGRIAMSHFLIEAVTAH